VYNTKVHKMTEEWKQVTIPGFSHYDVSSLSNIRTSKGHILKPTVRGKVALSGVTTRMMMYIHRISCLAFHGHQPSKNHTVDHIDRNWKNNNINNLRWATKSLQIRNTTNVPSKGFNVIYITPTGNVSYKSVAAVARHFDIDQTTLRRRLRRDSVVKVEGGHLKYDKLLPKKGSVIKTVPSWFFKDDENYKALKVSTCGLVLQGNNWTTGSLSDRPVKYFSVNVKGKVYRVHRLIIAAFLGEPGDDGKIYVNHKDGVGFNNNIENLEWVSPSGNSQHAVDTGLVRSLVPVVQYSLDGTRLQEFRSMADAAREVNGDPSHIISACKHGLSSYKYMWRRKNEAPEHIDPISRGSRRTEVRQYDLRGDLMNTFVSCGEASKSLRVSLSSITLCCKGKISLGEFTLQKD